MSRSFPAAHSIEVPMLRALLLRSAFVSPGVSTETSGKRFPTRLRHVFGGLVILVPSLQRESVPLPWGFGAWQFDGAHTPLYIAVGNAFLFGGAPEPAVAWHRLLHGEKQHKERYALLVDTLWAALNWTPTETREARRRAFRRLRAAALMGAQRIP